MVNSYAYMVWLLRDFRSTACVGFVSESRRAEMMLAYNKKLAYRNLRFRNSRD